MRKGISVTITVLVTAMILFISALLLGFMSRTTVNRAVDSIGSFLGINQETAKCNSIRTKCQTACQQACLTGGDTSNLVAERSEDGTVTYCQEHRCMTGDGGSWECTCGD